MSKSDYIEHVARISFGKDSLKMLDVIISRGLPLDRVTTTDVWATDTVRAEFPEVLEAKERIEDKLWTMYRLDVDHLCALNPDGTKRTYEQMFYHVPERRSQDVQVERENGSHQGQSGDSQTSGTSGANPISSDLPAYRVQGSITGFPPNTRYNWCQKLKIVGDSDQGMAAAERKTPVVPTAQGESQTCLFSMPYHEGQEKKDRGVFGHCGRRARSIRPAEQVEESSTGRVRR